MIFAYFNIKDTGYDMILAGYKNARRKISLAYSVRNKSTYESCRRGLRNSTISQGKSKNYTYISS
jgi:hypothetical protein